MKTSSRIALSAAAAIAIACFVAAPAHADYVMAPIGEVVKSVPIIVDATVIRIDPKTGNTHLEIHRVIRGAIDSKRPVITSDALTCTPGIGPEKYGAIAEKRHILLLETEDALFEETTFFEVTGDAKKPDSLRIRYPRHYGKGEIPGITYEEFAKRIAPPEPEDSK